MHSEAYPSLEGISSNPAKLCQSLHRNMKQTRKASQYVWCSLANSDINKQNTVNVGKMFDTLQETSERHTLNDKYENFVTLLHTEAAAKCKVSWQP